MDLSKGWGHWRTGALELTAHLEIAAQVSPVSIGFWPAVELPYFPFFPLWCSRREVSGITVQHPELASALAWNSWASAASRAERQTQSADHVDPGGRPWLKLDPSPMLDFHMCGALLSLKLIGMGALPLATGENLMFATAKGRTRAGLGTHVFVP